MIESYNLVYMIDAIASILPNRSNDILSMMIILIVMDGEYTDTVLVTAKLIISFIVNARTHPQSSSIDLPKRQRSPRSTRAG